MGSLDNEDDIDDEQHDVDEDMLDADLEQELWGDSDAEAEYEDDEAANKHRKDSLILQEREQEEEEYGEEEFEDGQEEEEEEAYDYDEDDGLGIDVEHDTLETHGKEGGDDGEDYQEEEEYQDDEYQGDEYQDDELDTEEEQHHEERSQVVSFETIARDEQGHINMSKLTLEQKKVWNATVMSLLTEDQMDRYECYRRTSVKEPVRRLIQVMVGGNPKNQDKPVIALAGATKVFVGELIEEARRIAAQQGYSGPLQPAHIRASYAALQDRGLVESDPPENKRQLNL